MASWQGKQGRSGAESFNKNEGVPGVVYILTNDAFRRDFYKIGCSRRSGATRATELNAQAVTAIPAMYRCVYEVEVADCGRAERLAHKKLQAWRHGKHGVDRTGREWGQEFFGVDLGVAIEAVKSACREVEEEIRERKRLQDAQVLSTDFQPWLTFKGIEDKFGEQKRLQDAQAKSPGGQEQLPSWASAAGGSSNPWPGSKPRSRLSTGALAGLVVVALLAWHLAGRKGEVTRPAATVVAQAQTPPLRPRPPPPPLPQMGTVGDLPPPPVVGMMAVEGRATAVEAPTQHRAGIRPFPASGSVTYRFGKVQDAKRAIQLKLIAPSASLYRFAVLVVAAPQERVYAVAYLEPNALAEVSLPAGRFRLVYSSGVEWFGESLMFGPRRELKSFGDEFDAGGGSTLVRAELPLE